MFGPRVELGLALTLTLALALALALTRTLTLALALALTLTPTLTPGQGVCTCAVDAQRLTLAQQIALFGAAGPPPAHAAASPPRAAAAAAAAAAAVPRLRALVGSHGANLVHALWAGRPCALVEVVPPPPRPAFDNYLSLAAALGLDYWLVPATLTLPPRQPAGRPGFPGAGSAAHDSRFSFAVDPHLLVRTLARALAMPPAESEAEGESEEESDDLCAALGSDVRVTDRIGVIS